LRTVAELHAAGFQIVAVPLAGLLAATHALRDVYRTLRQDGITTRVRDRMLQFGEMNTLLGVEERYRREREGLGWAAALPPPLTSCATPHARRPPPKRSATGTSGSRTPTGTRWPIGWRPGWWPAG